MEATGTGSTISLPALTTLTGTVWSFEAQGVDSLISLPDMTQLNVNGANVTATGGGTIELNSSLTSLTGVDLTVDASSTLPLGQFKSLTNCQVLVEGGTYSLSNLTNINGSSLFAEDGASLTLPSVTSYVGTNYGAYLEVGGTGSTLDLPLLTSITENNLYIEAAGSGNVIDLSALMSVTVGSGILTRDWRKRD